MERLSDQIKSIREKEETWKETIFGASGVLFLMIATFMIAYNIGFLNGRLGL